MRLSSKEVIPIANIVNLLKKAGIGLFFFLCLGQGFCVHARESVFEKDGEVYLIQSAQDMRTLALLVNGGKEVEPGVAAHNASYRLTRDIDISAYCMGEEGWEPIGYRDAADESLKDIYWEETKEAGEDGEIQTKYKPKNVGYFNGVFDGDNHVVTGLYINRPEEDMLGLFGERFNLGDWDSVENKSRESTVIKNLYIKDCDITGFYYVGGVIGGMHYDWEWADICIENCHVTGKISARKAGGIAGCAAVVTNSGFAGTVEGTQIGGIAATADYIESCAVHASLNGSVEVGGIAGNANCVRNSYVAGTVRGYDQVGGITGKGACLTGCYTAADVAGYNRTGGLIGYIYGMYCESTASTLKEYSGEVTIQNCLMGGCRMESEPKRGITTEFERINEYRHNGYIYGVPREKIESRVTFPLYYRDGLIVEGFDYKDKCLFWEMYCEPFDCTHLEETDFKDLLARPEEKWSDVWFCADDYAWPNLAWEKDSRFGYTVIVTVQEGDSLWELAEAVYGDGYFWTQIYEENKERIGGDASLILPGTDLEITVNASQADYAAKGEIWEQEETFLEVGRERGIARSELKAAYRRLLADDLWNGVTWKYMSEEYNRQISDWAIDDLDENGQTDMVVMAGTGGGMVPGEIWLYLNGEPAYILKDETAYYEENFSFGFGFWEIPKMGDFDNDGNPELVIEVFNGGNGGPGGRDTCLFRHVGDKWVECLEELPNDYGEPGKGEAGLWVHVACIGVDRYEAYCPYLDERIEFDGKNVREIGEDEYGCTVGSNVWGFYHLKCVKYEGKNALECREYLSGEGGNAHGVGVAVFILTWDADGVCHVADWRIEEWD